MSVLDAAVQPVVQRGRPTASRDPPTLGGHMSHAPQGVGVRLTQLASHRIPPLVLGRRTA